MDHTKENETWKETYIESIIHKACLMQSMWVLPACMCCNQSGK
jgi:hypothetical protein